MKTGRPVNPNALNKTGTQLIVIVPKDMKEQLVNSARKKGMSVADLVRLIFSNSGEILC